jgi:ankyrin repeat protein
VLLNVESSSCLFDFIRRINEMVITVEEYSKAIDYFVRSGSLSDDDRSAIRDEFNSRNVLDILRRKFLESLGALVIIERYQFFNRSKGYMASSKLFYASIKDVCTSLLENDTHDELISELLLRDFFERVSPNEEAADFDWMPECWAVSITGLEPNGALQLLKTKKLPTALKALRGGTMMHLAVASRNYVPETVGAVSSPWAARCKDRQGRLPLHWAAEKSRSVEVLDHLIALNPDATREEDAKSRTPIALIIERASFPEQVEMLKYLARADPKSCTLVTSNGRKNLFHIFASAHRTRNGDVKGAEMLFEALLEIVPKEYLLEGDDYSDLPLHSLGAWSRLPASIMPAMIRACPEAVRYHNSSNCSPARYALQLCGRIENVKLLVDAYPESVDLFDLLGSQEVENHPSDMVALVESHIRRFPDSVRQIDEKTGDLPLHRACRRRNPQVVKLIYEKYPGAITRFSHNGRLPLHIAIDAHDFCELIDDYRHRPLFDEIVRFLVSRCPESVNMKKTFDDDVEEGDDGDDNDERMTESPIEMISVHVLPTATHRLLLRLCPEADEELWRQMNYRARREAMFIAFAAITRQQQGTQSFVWQIRRLMLMDQSMSLLKHVISFI